MVVTAAHHRMPEAEARDRKFQRRRHPGGIGGRIGGQEFRVKRRAGGQNLVHHIACADRGQESVQDQPLVMETGQAAGFLEVVAQIDQPVVQAQEGHMQLRHRQVFVVAPVGRSAFRG